MDDVAGFVYDTTGALINVPPGVDCEAIATSGIGGQIVSQTVGIAAFEDFYGKLVIKRGIRWDLNLDGALIGDGRNRARR